MTVRKLPSGKFYAVLKSGRAYVAGRAFNTRREANAWLARERAALAGGVDPRAGRASVRSLLPVWLAERKDSVSAKTYVADAAVPRLTPPALAALSVAAVTDREVSRALLTLSRRGFAESSVRRYRASLSSFFAWAVRDRLITTNPVRRPGSRVRPGHAERCSRSARPTWNAPTRERGRETLVSPTSSSSHAGPA